MSSQSGKVFLPFRYYSVSTVDNWAKSESNIYNINGGNVAVGNNYTNPQAQFDVSGQTLLKTSLFRIGEEAGAINQNTSAIAIGYQAGMTNQGASSICIGAFSSSTFPNSIVLNATGSPLVADSSNALFIKPLDISTGFSNFLVYDTTSGKISYNTKSAKTFVIDNPIHNDKYLVHSCLEGSEAGVYYRGESKIINNNYVEIQLPSYCTTFTNFTTHLTPIDKRIKLYATKVQDSTFKVYGENCEFYWYVFATREVINTEIIKNDYDIIGDGPYRFVKKL